MQEHAPYHNLAVYRKAYQLALRIHKESLGFPKFEQYELAQQLRRSSKSIVVNVVEGMGRQARQSGRSASFHSYRHGLV